MGLFSRLFGSKAAVTAAAWAYTANEDWAKNGIAGTWTKPIKIGRRTRVDLQVIEYRPAGDPPVVPIPTGLVEIGGEYGQWTNMARYTSTDDAKARVERAIVYLGRRARWI